MLSVPQAIAAILKEIQPFAPVDVRLQDALGLVLAADARSDVDSPPFDKSLMDGYAVRAADVAGSEATLAVVEEVTAGRVPTRPVGRGEATRIMTGAPLPQGADAVVRIEDTEFDSVGGKVRIRTSQPVAPGANIMRRGHSHKKDDLIVPAGRVLRPQELGALAELGKSAVAVRRRPRAAVLATGDELVPIEATPGPGQIRNSNECMLAAQLAAMGAEAVLLGIARDERKHLRERLDQGLECDLLVLAGGVSAGKLDLVPSELEGAGVRQVFHHVDLKPGKPTWFGVLGRPKPTGGAATAERCYVFGLPGNPVSSMVCCELFTRTAVRRLMGFPNAEPAPIRARLKAAHHAKSDRPTYHPSRFTWHEGLATVEPLPWVGSSDLSATVEANATALFPAGDRQYNAGDIVDAYLWQP